MNHPNDARRTIHVRDFARAWSSRIDEEVDLDERAGKKRLLAAAGRRRSSPSRNKFAFFAVAISVGIVALAVGLFFGRPLFEIDGRPGQTGERLLATVEPVEVTFRDGSEVALVDGEMAVPTVDERGAVLDLFRGRVGARIEHHNRARWVVVAGPYRVHVRGTVFSVTWTPARATLSVSVASGMVEVRGQAPEPSFVHAGETLELGPEIAKNERPAELPSDRHLHKRDAIPNERSALESAAREKRNPLPDPPTPIPPGGASSIAWRELEQAGQYPQAVAAAEEQGIHKIFERGSSDDVMTLARAARHAGRPRLELDALVACRTRFPSTNAASMAAFLLGRHARGTEAVDWYRVYLREQPDGVLRREALGRIVEAYDKVGEVAAAKEAAKRYLRVHPEGPHAPLSRSLLGVPP